MKKIFAAGLVLASYLTLYSQKPDSATVSYMNSADLMINSSGRLNLGGYGEVHFNQPLTDGIKETGTLDVHRLVVFLGYNFSSKTQFVSEIEVEYAKEVWVEQAFIQHRLNKFMNLRAGLMLIPMGIINEYHEPTTFNGVERPLIDNKLSLSTWREIGAGFSGNIIPVNIKYQLYVTGGLNGYDTKALFNGSSGLREGRQKGSKAYLSSPALSGKVEYFGIRNLNLGLSGYFGKSQSRLYNKLPSGDVSNTATADSSVVGISILGADMRYQRKGLELRGQVYYTALSNTYEYNKFTGSGSSANDLGKTMVGYYAEAGYNVLRLYEKTQHELVPFIRYEFLDMHNTVDEGAVRKAKYRSSNITAGLTWKLHKQAAVKADIQFSKPADTGTVSKVLNAGIGVMF